jgi:Flp pilus assembly protein TadD
VSRAELAAAADQLKRQGNLAGACALYERLHRENPADFLCLALLADTLVANRQAGKALNLIESLVDSAEPAQLLASPELSSVKAKALLAVGRWPEALQWFQLVVMHHSHWPDGWNNLGCCLLEQGRDGEAAARFRRALELNPTHIEANLSLAKIYKQLGRLEQSRNLYESLLEKIDHHQTRHELVAILLRLNETKLALFQAQRLVNDSLSNIDDHMLLARAFFLNDDLDGYIDCLEAIPQKLWKGVSTESLVIGTLAESGRIHQARQRLTRHLAEHPADANAQLIHARDLLSRGEFAQGWRAYAHRLRLPQNQLHFGMEPNWMGQPLKGETILIIGEQGVGDVCYFSRFIKPLLKDNPNCSMLVEPRMISLLESTYPDLHLLCDPEQVQLLPSPLVRIALGSLPLLYGNSKQEIDRLYEPLNPREAELLCIQSQFKRDAKFPNCIGISLLAGRPADEYQQRKRTVPFRKVLQQLASLPITLVDLQHNGHPPEFYAEAERLGIQVLRYSNLTDNLGMLAAAIASVKGVITAQQTNAHLCGSLGKSGLAILPPGCHFVYGEQAHSAWYPRLDLIRSKHWGDWDVIEAELPKHLNNWL